MTRHGCALAVSSDEELQPMLQGILSGAIDPGAWWPVGRTSLPHPLPPSAIWPCATQVRKITTDRTPAGSACGVFWLQERGAASVEPERCVFGVFFPHTGQYQPHDLVMT